MRDIDIFDEIVEFLLFTYITLKEFVINIITIIACMYVLHLLKIEEREKQN